MFCPISNGIFSYVKKMAGPIKGEFSMDTKNDEKPKSSEIRDIKNEFAENTTMHGIPRFLDAERSIVQRVLWLLVVFVSTVILVAQASNLIIDYAKYQTTTKVTIVTKSKLEFPSVTICNLNMLRRSKLSGKSSTNS